MTVDLLLQLVYKCMPCRFATTESRGTDAEDCSLDNGPPPHCRTRLDRRRCRDLRGLELGREEERQQLHASGHWLAAGGRPAEEPVPRAGGRRRPDRLARAGGNAPP